jgi:hypothetical protein
MRHWSEEHRAFAVETFFKNNDSATVMQRVFQRHFDIGRNGKVPTRQTILNWVKQFKTTASVVNKKPPVRPQTVRTPENVHRVAHAFQRSPQRSARRHSIALHSTPRTSKSDLTMMCVSPRHLQRCWHGAKCKSSNCFCPTLYKMSYQVKGKR